MSEENQINEQIADLEAQVQAAEAAADKMASESQNNETTAESSNPAADTTDYDAKMKEMVEAKVAAELASIKNKLNEAYSARDEAVKAKVQLEDEKRQAEIKRMEEEGKHKEVAELRLAEMQAKLDALTKENTMLTRDHSVDSALRGMDFRSDVAASMAKDRVVSELIQDEVGIWRHRSGVSIKEFVDSFAKDEANSFLFKAKTNSGAGMPASPAAGTDPKQATKPLSEMSSEEMLQHFASQAGGQAFTGNW